MHTNATHSLQVCPDGCPPSADLSNIVIADVMNVDMVLENKVLWINVVRPLSPRVPAQHCTRPCSAYFAPQLPHTIKATISALIANKMLQWSDVLEVRSHPNTHTLSPSKSTRVCWQDGNFFWEIGFTEVPEWPEPDRCAPCESQTYDTVMHCHLRV